MSLSKYIVTADGEVEFNDMYEQEQVENFYAYMENSDFRVAVDEEGQEHVVFIGEGDNDLPF